MRETLNGFQGRLQIGEQMITNLRYADDIILLATKVVHMIVTCDRLPLAASRSQFHHGKRALLAYSTSVCLYNFYLVQL